MQPHVSRLGELRLDRAIRDADSDFIVAEDDCRRLRVAEVRQYLAFADCDLCSAEGAGVLGFLDGRADDGNAVGHHGDRRVHERGVGVAAEVVEGARNAACVGPR